VGGAGVRCRLAPGLGSRFCLSFSPETTSISAGAFIDPAFALKKIPEQLFLGLVFRRVLQNPGPLAAHLAIYLLGIRSKHDYRSELVVGELEAGTLCFDRLEGLQHLFWPLLPPIHLHENHVEISVDRTSISD
jgi:hypothetical protein